MTSAIATRRFTRLEVQSAMEGLPYGWAEMVLQRLGSSSSHYGTSVKNSLTLMFDQNRPALCSPNTYAGMAWDRARVSIGNVVGVCDNHANVWERIDDQMAIANSYAESPLERAGYTIAVQYASWFIEQQFGARPAPPPEPVPPPQTFPEAVNGLLNAVLVDPARRAESVELVNEADFPALFQNALMDITRVWAMLPKDAKVFAAKQLAGWLRSIDLESAADEVETMHLTKNG